MSGKKFSLTTPIYYVNGLPHIGHSYSTIAADALARYHRLAGEAVYFQTGADLHGEKVQGAAEDAGETPAHFAARVSDIWQSTWDRLDIRYDRFIRTTDADHRRAVAKIANAIHDAGQIEFREYEGLYCVGCERFLTDRDTKDGLCRDHETKPEARREANYFFKMSEHFDWLARELERHPELIEPERYRNEVLAMIREGSGLEDLCISRPKERLSWGIELPFDSNYVCYVWFDALVNYLSGCGWPDKPDWEARWRACTHLIGKDILKPHGVFWPTMLHAAGLPLFRGLRVHGHWQVEARKVSKSLGNMIDPLRMKARYGFEPFRYFLLREMSFGLDGSFNEDAMIERANAQLSNALGNLLSRTLNMTARYCEGVVPEPDDDGPDETVLRDACAAAATAVDHHLRRFELHRALEAVFQLVDAANRYIDRREPWKAARTAARAGELRTTLASACRALRSIGLLLAPFLPEASAELLRRLGLGDALRNARLPDDAARWNMLIPGTPTSKGDALFPRLERQDDD